MLTMQYFELDNNISELDIVSSKNKLVLIFQNQTILYFVGNRCIHNNRTHFVYLPHENESLTYI